MKQIALAVMVVFAASVCFAVEADKKKEEKYEVTITIVYNEVSSAEALEIAERAHKNFKNTCKHVVQVKKVTENINSFITLGTSNSIYYNPTAK